jgi:GR25 family glycosyltransferase involved in LPS biosynthesis
MGLKNVIRFEAIEDVIGLRGCTKSHLQLWRQLYTSNSEIAFICEDDIRFIGSIRLLKQVLWDTLVLEDVQMVCLANYTSEEGIFRTRNLRFSSKVQAAAIYLVKRNFLPKLIPYGEKSILELTESQGKTGSIDKVWMRLQVQNPFAIPVKKICIQYYGHSDIRKKRSFYTH